MMRWSGGTGWVIPMTGTRCASLAILFFMTAGHAADGAVRRSTQAVTRTVWDGVYSVAQAARGHAVYESQCERCHQPDLNGTDEASSLVGEAFMQAWREDTVGRRLCRVIRLRGARQSLVSLGVPVQAVPACLLHRPGTNRAPARPIPINPAATGEPSE